MQAALLQNPVSERKPQRGPNTPRTAWRGDAPRQTRFQEALHEGHWNGRATIINALLGDPRPRLKRRGLRLCSCGTGASFYVDAEAGKVKPWLSRCKDRMCPFCGIARTMGVTDQLETLMLEHQCKRMIILTLRAVFESLQDCVNYLMTSFRKLRKTKLWKTYVEGGAYVLEVTRNAKTGLWHPHLHVAYKGIYFPQQILKARWLKITYDSYVVWVSKIDDAPGAAREMAKYVGKPQKVESWPADAIREYALATHGLRMVQTFGSCHGQTVTDRDVHEDLPDKTERVRLSDLLHLTRLGHESAGHLLALVAERWPVFGRYVHHEMPQLLTHAERSAGAEALLRLLRAESSEKPRPPPRAVDVDPLDARINMAFLAFIADRNRGAFKGTQSYFDTETEHLGRTM